MLYKPLGYCFTQLAKSSNSPFLPASYSNKITNSVFKNDAHKCSWETYRRLLVNARVIRDCCCLSVSLLTNKVSMIISLCHWHSFLMILVACIARQKSDGFTQCIRQRLSSTMLWTTWCTTRRKLHQQHALLHNTNSTTPHQLKWFNTMLHTS